MSTAAAVKALLLQGINERNVHQWAEGELDFAAPQVSSVEGSNTSVEVSAVGNPQIVGVQSILYNRVDLGTAVDPIAGETGTVIAIGMETTIHEIVPQIAAAFGLVLSVEDVVDGPIPAADEVTEVITASVVADAGSFAWIGSREFKFTRSEIQVASLIPNNVDSGLELADLQPAG